MNSAPLLATMLAGRELLGRSNPRLLDWSTRQWRAWREREQSPHAFGAMPRFIAVAALTCLDDLRLHAGLMQLLHLPGLRANLVLTLPSNDALEVARSQARREAWLGLVAMVAEADWPALQAGFAPDQPLALFPGPTMLTASELATARALLEAPGSGDSVDIEYVIVRRAGDLGSVQAHTTLPGALGRLLAIDPDALGIAESNDQPRSECATAARQASIRHEGGRVDLPPLQKGDELLVIACPDHGSAQSIARLSGDIHEGQRQVRLFPPAALLTTRPQRLRIEMRRGEGAVTASDLLFHVPPARLEPWMLSAFLNRGGAGNPVVQAFAEGTGCRLAFAEDEPEILRDIPIVWGVLRQSDRILDQAKRQSLYYFYIDHAYFDRGHCKSYRIARNAYEAGPVRACPSDRFDALGVVTGPWRKGGHEIIVCPPTEYFMQAHGCPDWLETTLTKLNAVTDRPIVVRTKPQHAEAAVPLPQALETAHALVTHSSNVAIEAACLGTPVFVSPMSAAAPVGRTDLDGIETPAYPDRAAWLAHLAYNQFSFEEIGDGRAWRMLRELECRELA